MKLVQAEKTFETNAQFTSQDFTIGDVSVVIEILRNKMYKHKIRTLVQEYISNARDATREVNGTKPIEITVPTTFEPTFKVRDFGPGISPDRMYNVFIKYASSTKRDSNKQTGGFGIGAKSAWSYTESFTIVTHIDGVQRTYVAHIGANNNGRLDYLGESNTDQENGTEIQIPVSPGDVYQFKKAALRAVYFWKKEEQPVFKNIPQTELVQHVKGETVDYVEISTDIPDFIAGKYETGTIISIDGIPYFLDYNLVSRIKPLQNLLASVKDSARLILHLNNGELEVAASREELSDSKYTLDNLARIASNAKIFIDEQIKSEFRKAKNPFDHLSIFVKLNNFYNLKNYTKFGDFHIDENGIKSELFNSVSLTSCVINNTNNAILKENMMRYRRGYRRASSIPLASVNSLYFIDTKESMVTTNLRIRQLLQTNKSVIVLSLPDEKNPDGTLKYDKAAFDTIKTSLGFKPLSSVSFVKPPKTKREIVKTNPRDVFFSIQTWSYDNSRESVSTTLNENTEKWIYISQEEAKVIDSVTLRDLNIYLNQYRRSGKWTKRVGILSDKTVKRVKTDSNFIHLNDFLKSYNVTAKDISNAMNNSEIGLDLDLIKHLDKLPTINSPVIAKAISYLSKLDRDYDAVPELLKPIVYKHQDVVEFIKDMKAAAQLIEEKFLLLKVIDWYGLNRRQTKELLTDISNYINNKK